MEYVIPLVLVLLLVAGFVAFLVLNATKKRGPAATGDDAPGVGADKRTPLGDTTEHADEQTEQATTLRDADGGAQVAQPGEGEGRARLGRDDDDEPARPASERLANRDV